jgi:hypothetical protein
VATIDWDDASIEDMLHSLDGPVGKFITAKSLEMTALAQVGAPLQKPKNWSWGRNSTSYEPRSFGYLKGSVHPSVGYTKAGQLYGGTNAMYGPTFFLEYGGGRYGHARRIPFMSTALYAATID